MTAIMPQIRPEVKDVKSVTYNPATRAFEGRVTLRDGDEIYTYPCALRAPIDMDSAVVVRQLAELAARRHARAHRPMHAHRPEAVLPGHVPPEVSQATDALWLKLLHRAA